MFKVGDRLVVWRNGTTLDRNKIYTIKNVLYRCYELNEIIGIYETNIFISLKEYRKRKFEKLKYYDKKR